MKKGKGSSFVSFLFAMVAIGGAVAAISAYIKSKKAAEEIREDFLADLGYDFDDGTYYADADSFVGDFSAEEPESGEQEASESFTEE